MRWLLIAGIGMVLVLGCAKEEAKPEARPPVEVVAIKVAPRDTPVTFEYVGQTQSSHQVQIVARVSGFLEKRVYTEGSLVKAGAVMFLQDPKPFQATLNAYKGALAEQQARLQVANDNLAQVKPLAALNALSQKELDDATGQQQAAAAAVETAKANVEQAQLNLGYTTITTPVTGLSSFARIQEGQYLSGQSSLLTTVDQVDPIWVNFTLSENDMLSLRTEQAAGRLTLPKADSFVVEVVLADGSVFPNKGRITFTNAEYNQQTGTFLVRATLPNPGSVLRPGQFVRVRVSGASRPNAILVPQQAVLQGAQGHFVFVVDKDAKAQMRAVEAGSWNGGGWFINKGLSAGDTVVTDGIMRLAPDAPVKVVDSLANAQVKGSASDAKSGVAPADPSAKR
ncbi:MAG TPA: efflux RND transporter periplasmic adaptor subunit [Casimicrobiaceae bacterium]|nr:efflux RND transporter periplasmic adaptor subunit [Casimicrobiaceae bacterium]